MFTSSINYSIKSGNNDLSGLIFLQKLVIIEDMTDYPIYHAYFGSKSNAELYSIKDITLKISIEGTGVTLNLGIGEVDYTQEGLYVVKGYLCKSDRFLTPRIKYLGNNLKTAISSLGFPQTIDLTSSPNGEYNQIGETDLECLLRLCQLGATYPYYSISTDKISLREPTKPPKIMREINMNLSSYNPFQLSEIKRVKSGELITTSRDKYHLISFRDNTLENNYLRNLDRFTRPKDLYIFQYRGLFELDLGEKASVVLPEGNSIILTTFSKITTITNDTTTDPVISKVSFVG